MTNNMEKGCMKCGSKPRHNQTDEDGSYLCLSCEQEEKEYTIEIKDYWIAEQGKIIIIKASEDTIEEYIANICGDCSYGEFKEFVDLRNDYCDDCEGPCKSEETEACDECGIELPIGCGNNPSDQSIFNGCCDDCREESIDEE